MDVVSLSGGIKADECPKCKGRWFDHDELAKSVADRGRYEKAIATGPLRPRPGKANCPRCLKVMTNGGLGNEFLRVDMCSAHGIWLDAGEQSLLEKLLAA